MKTLKTFALCALLLAFFAKSYAGPIASVAKSPKKSNSTTSYVIHYQQYDLGHYEGYENYKVCAYVTTNVDTTYADRITVDESITTSWDAPSSWNVTISSGTSLGTFYFTGPPGNYFGPSFFEYVTLSTNTYSGEPLTIDEDVTYFPYE
jgi:hypothetical protein